MRYAERFLPSFEICEDIVNEIYEYTGLRLSQMISTGKTLHIGMIGIKLCIIEHIHL